MTAIGIGLSVIFNQPELFGDFYVDSENGDDANTGKSPIQAFETIAQLLTESIPTGTRIALARGSSWKESLILPGSADNVAIFAYGTGDDPLLDGSDEIDAGDFSKTAGRTNVYQATISYEAESGAAAFLGVWEDDVRFTLAADLATCDSTPSTDFHALDYTGTSGTLYIHASDSSNPGASGKTYEHTARLYQIDAFNNSNDATIIVGIHTRRNHAHKGTISLRKYCRLFNVTCEDSNSQSLSIQGSSILFNTHALNTYITGSTATFFSWSQGDGNDEDITFINCTAEQEDPATYGEHVGFFGQYTSSGAFGTITLTDCTAIGCLKGIASQYAAGFTINDFTATNCTNAFFCADNTPLTVDGFTVTHSGTGVLCLDDNGATIILTDGTCEIENVGAGAGLISSNYASDITLNNSQLTLNNNSTSGNNFIFASNAGVKITSSGNTFFAPNLAAGPYVYQCINDVDLTSDNNIFCDADLWFLIGASDHRSVAAYQAGESQDLNSTVGGCS